VELEQPCGAVGAMQESRSAVLAKLQVVAWQESSSAVLAKQQVVELLQMASDGCR